MARRETPLFHPDERPGYAEAFGRLPVVTTIGGLPVRWFGPLVELGHDVTIAELGREAWQQDDEVGWAWRLERAGPVLTAGGRVRRRFSKAFAQAVWEIGRGVQREEWAAWLAFEWNGLHDVVRERARRMGVAAPYTLS